MTIPVKDAMVRCYNTEPTCRVEREWPQEVLTGKGNWHIKWPSVIVRHATDFVQKQTVDLNHTTLFYREEGKCAYCREYTVNGTKDHVIPTSKGGPNDWTNVVWACKDCNTRKANKMPKGMWKPKVPVFKPTYWELLKNRKKFPLYIQTEDWLPYVEWLDWEGDVIITMKKHLDIGPNVV